MAKLTAQWRKIGEAQSLQRSSQVVAIAEGQAYVFGGELEPRKPRDNDIHVFGVHERGGPSSFHVSTSPSKHSAPSPRVGSAATTINGKIYIFSGRGGIAMAPIDESGGVWEYTTSTLEWTLLSPSNSSAEAMPEARSFHCLASNGHDTLYLHAGCPEKGRLSDLWAFQISEKTWTKLRPAPEPGRGGTSIAFAGMLLFRMNGYDGKNELGGALDIYDPAEDSWTSHTWAADGQSGPGPRSVATLLPLQIGGKDFLLTMFGERDPSALGHEGAGKMLDDVWAFDLAGKQWHMVEGRGDEGLSREEDRPVARGWFAADSLGTSALVQGGVGETNTRLGDAWLLVLD
ncbi:hypothetical protein B0A48_18488 [Cryoendolithus antarcticus]|uniref:Nitrile-specifier protein 5 n=1 Tax=Cryoendolithus antarcticus TaxID=1507870 RepID=A0A1V8S9B5_9PEZI|nr:hypothetical protein B0A48_18488 [Cryoendolithus antarcticus]